MAQVLHEAFLVGVDDISCPDMVDNIRLADRFAVVEVRVMAVVDVASVTLVRV